MESAKIDCFFSCSFKEEDGDINEFFKSICIGLDINCVNVSNASSDTPPEVAVELIDKSQILIAICTRRDRIEGGSFVMPQAVQNEISIAYGKGIPVLMFIEEGVSTSGFYANFGSYLTFNRNNMASNENLLKFIKSIHDAKLKVVAPHHVGINQGLSDSYADFVNHLVELKKDGEDFIWEYSTTKKLVYVAQSRRPFNVQIWAQVPAIIPEGSPAIQWSCELHSSTRGIHLNPVINKQTSAVVDVLMKLEPAPDNGDQIEYSTSVSSRYINPIWRDEVAEGSFAQLDDGEYLCSDGLIFIHRTKRAVIEFRIDKQYKLHKGDIRPFVASYTSTIDYEVHSELARAKTRMEDFGRYIIYRMEVDSPLPGHMYGIAWNPPSRPK